MEKIPLKSLDGKRIGLEIALSGRRLQLCGEGRYEGAGEGDGLLRVLLPNADIPEIILREKDWTGEVVVSETDDCDFLIRLDAALLAR